MSIKPIMYVTQTLNLHLTMSYLDHILILVTNLLFVVVTGFHRHKGGTHCGVG